MAPGGCDGDLRPLQEAVPRCRRGSVEGRRGAREGRYRMRRGLLRPPLHPAGQDRRIDRIHVPVRRSRGVPPFPRSGRVVQEQFQSVSEVDARDMRGHVPRRCFRPCHKEGIRPQRHHPRDAEDRGRDGEDGGLLQRRRRHARRTRQMRGYADVRCQRGAAQPRAGRGVQQESPIGSAGTPSRPSLLRGVIRQPNNRHFIRGGRYVPQCL